MGDGKTKRDRRDRNKVNADKHCELEYFAQRNKISMDEACGLMRQFGDSRPTVTSRNTNLKA
jgi:hypothetical protein